MSAGWLPDSITVEFLAANLEAVRLVDLGAEFVDANGLRISSHDTPFRVAISQQTSKAGNTFYEYSQNRVPFPDGLATFIRVEGVVVPLGRVHPSKNSGYPTREGTTQIVLGCQLYRVTAYLTESKSPFYVKVIAHKMPGAAASGSRPQVAPRGGRIIS